MSEGRKKVRYTIDLEPEEWEILEEYAKRTGVSKADIVRSALRGFFQKNYIDLSKINLEHFEACIYVFERVIDVLTRFAKIMIKAGKLARIEAEWEGFEKFANLIKAYVKRKEEEEKKGKEESEEPSLLELVKLFLAMKGETQLQLPPQQTATQTTTEAIEQASSNVQ